MWSTGFSCICTGCSFSLIPRVFLPYLWFTCAFLFGWKLRCMSWSQFALCEALLFIIALVNSLCYLFHYCYYGVLILFHPNACKAVGTWASEGFSPGGATVDFSRSSQKDFPCEEQKWWNCILPTQNQENNFFSKNLLGKCQILKSSKGPWPLFFQRPCVGTCVHRISFTRWYQTRLRFSSWAILYSKKLPVWPGQHSSTNSET